MEAKDQGEKVTRTVCMIHDAISCGILAHVKDGMLTKVEPADFPEPIYRYACSKSLSTPKLVYHPDRLKYPMKRTGERGEGKWERISWDEALDTIASRLKDIAARYGPESVVYMSGGVSPPSGGIFSGQRFASASGATYVLPHGFAAAGGICANMLNYGTQFADYLWDHDEPRLCVLWGENTLETAGWKYRRVRDARERGAKMVVVNPIFTATAAKADEWIPIRPGTDVALILGMINVILSEGLCDEAFVIEHTVGPFLVRSDNGLFLREEHLPSGDSTTKYMVWDTRTNKPQACDTPGASPALSGSYRVDGIECKTAFQLLAELAEQYPLEKASEITEVAPDAIRRLALDHVNRKPALSYRGLGLQRAYYGDLTFRAITTLAAVTGNICLKLPEADPFATLNFIPFVAPGGRFYKQVSTLQLYDTVLTEKPYPIKALWVSTLNPATSFPNRNKFKEVMSRMEYIVVVELFMSTTTDYADIVLPGCTTFECTNLSLSWGSYLGSNPYLQLQQKVIEPLYESKSDMEIFNELSKRMGLEEFFDKSEEEYIEILLSSGHPSMEGITMEKLREGPMKPKPHTGPLFNTPSGRIEFYAERMKEFGQELSVYIESPDSARQPRAQKYPLYIIQMHHKARHHSMFVGVDGLREFEPEPVLDMNPVDAEKRGIQDGDMVMAFNDRGKVKVKARVHEGIRPGTVIVGEGWQPKHFAEGSYQELTSTTINPAQEAAFESIAQMQGILVEVKKA